MGYDRYDERGGRRDERSRWSDDRGEGWRRDEDWRRDERGERGGGGFLERAGDQIASWFGGDDDDRGRRHRDEGRGHEPDWRGERGSGRGDEGWFGSRGSPHRDRDRDERYRAGDWSNSRSDYRGEDRDYRPMAGDYGRSGYRREEMRGGGRSKWDRDEYRNTSFAGSREQFNYRDSDIRDRHYHEQRQRHLDEFDRDYDDYRRERQSSFESDFGSWRERRQSKRQMLGQVREHMKVVGKDGEPVGTVDRVAGDRIILARSDAQAGGSHHSLSCTDLDRIEGDRLILETSAEQARRRWRDEDRERALFEREDQGEAGPHMLDRSFSGTYR